MPRGEAGAAHDAGVLPAESQGPGRDRAPEIGLQHHHGQLLPPRGRLLLSDVGRGYPPRPLLNKAAINRRNFSTDLKI